MKKILVYSSGQIGHIIFGAFKFLQEEMDIEISTIIDRSDNSKKFFENQNIVKIHKNWFYRDYTKKSKSPDIEYLKKIEEKYSINLWQLAYADPTFYGFDGNSKFDEKDILSLIENDCKLFEKILDETKPDYFLAHVGGQKQMNIFQAMCKSRGIETIHFATARFGDRFQMSKEYEILDKNSEVVKIGNEEKLTKEYLENLKKKLDLFKVYRKKSVLGYNLNKFSFVKATLQNFPLINKESHKQYTNFKNSNFTHQNFSLILKNIQKIFRRRFLYKNSINEVNLNDKFVFFALHMQPEMTTGLLTPFFADQLTLIKNIARALPINYFLYVKEHVSMGKFFYWRDIDYYKEILKIPNVKMLNPQMNTSKIIDAADLIITINGSISYEATMHQKQALVFGDVSNENLPCITRIKNIEELPRILREILKQPFNDYGCKKYFETKFNETIPMDYSIYSDLHELFFLGNTSIDDITDKKMHEFIERNKSQLIEISNEFVRKLEQYEKHNQL